MTGRGLEGGPCPEYDRQPQRTPDGMRPCGAMCRRCGRVTARRDSDGYAWCGGSAPVSSTQEGQS